MKFIRFQQFDLIVVVIILIAVGSLIVLTMGLSASVQAQVCTLDEQPQPVQVGRIWIPAEPTYVRLARSRSCNMVHPSDAYSFGGITIP